MLWMALAWAKPVELTVDVVREPTIAAFELKTADSAVVNVVGSTWTSRSMPGAYGDPVVFQRGQTVQLTVDAPDAVSTTVTIVLPKKKRHRVTIELPAREVDEARSGPAVLL